MAEEQKSSKRDDYFRCPICKELFADKDCTLTDRGYVCPSNCQPSFEQPPYESPFNDDN